MLDHAWVAGNHSAGVSVRAATASLHDVEIVDTASNNQALESGTGLQVGANAQVEVERVRLTGNERLGILLDGTGTTLTGADVEVRESLSFKGDGTAGAGLAAQTGAKATLSRVIIADNRTAAVSLTDPGTVVTLEDAVLEDTSSDVAYGAWGRAAHAQGGARLVLTRAVLARNRDVGLFVGGGATALLTDVRVQATDKRACVAAGSCPDRGGSGVVVLGADAAVTLRRFEIRGSAQCGLQLAEGGVADASEGEVGENVVGACVQTTDFDFKRISDRISYRGNTQKLVSTVVPLPDLTLPRH